MSYSKESLAVMKKGEVHKISGTLLTVRDGTLKYIKKLGKPPVSFENKLLFFCGPTPTPKGKIIGSVGPTTTDRMTDYFEMLLSFGALGFLGKGDVDSRGLCKTSTESEISESCRAPLDKLFKNRAVLFSVTGGIGALLSQCVVSSRVVALEELGAEAIYELEVKDFPVLVSKSFLIIPAMISANLTGTAFPINLYPLDTLL